ncbi:MAG: OmpA family protein [Prevotellaceae bacterium]|nr:OmpA family protein [Prevotellaceae bacterium]MDO4931840.1 OmpA family protein [Prevotellaceae bacterium]
MNIKKTIFATLLAGVAVGASAQDTPKTEYVFQPHWYVQAQAGGQYTLGEISMGKLLSPNAQIGVGYNFDKLFGARFVVNGWQSKGGSEIQGNTYKWKYNYFSPVIDLTFNVSNFIAGVNPNRLVDVSAFIGGGVTVAMSNDDAVDVNSELLSAYGPVPVASREASQYLRYLWDGTKAYGVGRMGLQADFKATKKLSVGLEVAANFTSDKYNSKKSGNADWYFNALVGVKYNIGETYKENKIEPVAPKVIYRDRIVEKVVEKPVEVVSKAVAEPMRIDIFFNLAGFKLLNSEAQKVEQVAKYLQKNPNAKVTITGLADKGTGTDKINIPLSQKRADLVKNTLINKYGIAADRITAVGKGSSEQPFDVPELNRVSICVAE